MTSSSVASIGGVDDSLSDVNEGADATLAGTCVLSSAWVGPGVEHKAGGGCRGFLVVVVSNVVMSMDAGVLGIGVGSVAEDAGESRKVEGAGEAVADTTDVVANRSSIRWRLRSISLRILASSKTATMRLTVVAAPVFMAMGGSGDVADWLLGLAKLGRFGGW